MSGQGSSLQHHGGIARRAHRQLKESPCCVDRRLSCDVSTQHDVGRDSHGHCRDVPRQQQHRRAKDVAHMDGLLRRGWTATWQGARSQHDWSHCCEQKADLENPSTLPDAQ